MIVILGVSNTGAAPAAVGPAAVQPAAGPGNYDFTTYGTSWIPEVLGQYNWWHARGWGMQAKPKTIGDKWVHIPLPYPSGISNTAMKVTYIEFCAQSANGAAGTGPNQMDIYSDGAGLFHSEAITWWADNSRHCWGYRLPTQPGIRTWASRPSSLSKPFDLITLYKAWVRVVPGIRLKAGRESPVVSPGIFDFHRRKRGTCSPPRGGCAVPFAVPDP